jgi:hypothetical protein
MGGQISANQRIESGLIGSGVSGLTTTQRLSSFFDGGRNAFTFG